MSEFKINLIYKSDTESFQSMMNDLFLQYLTNQLNTCNTNNNELSYT